jgi:hypothetical protein
LLAASFELLEVLSEAVNASLANLSQRLSNRSLASE